jgi:hypothetical protein
MFAEVNTMTINGVQSVELVPGVQNDEVASRYATRSRCWIPPGASRVSGAMLPWFGLVATAK